MNIRIPLLALLLTAGGAAAFAQEIDTEPTASKRAGRGFDLDHMQARSDRLFDAADADDDGMVTQAEFMAAEHPRGAHGRGRGRGPGPGPEMAAMGAEINANVFTALDTDGSGEISAEEFTRIHEVMRQVMKTRMFERLDANGDGVLHRDELSPRHARMQALDVDGDGKVTRDEIQAAKQPAADG